MERPIDTNALQPAAGTTEAGPTDEHLLRRFARGDQEALGALAERHERALLGLASALLAGREDLAAEAVQDAWVRVIRSAKHFAFRSSVKTWLYRIVINRCHDVRSSGRLGPPRDGRAPEAAVPAAGASPIEDASLRRAVDGLPGDRRLIVVLCYHRGLSHSQAADVLGIPAGTLKSRLSAALAELRAALASEIRP